MRKKALISGLIIAMSVMSLTGCSRLKSEMKSAMANNQEIKLSVEGEVSNNYKSITWGELDQLTTYPKLREIWDDELQIIKFDYGSKNGMIYVDTQGNWAGNNTLYNAFQNKEFSAVKWSDNKAKSKFAQAAMEEFRDLKTESTAIFGSVNAYFNILPACEDGTSGLLNNLSRAQVLTAIYRGDTPVTFNDENAEFKAAVGTSVYNTYAQEVADISYLKYQNRGLNYDTYNSACTRAEAIYALVQRYFKQDYDNVDIKSVEFTDCKNAGNILKKIGATEDSHAVESYVLEWCLQNPEDGCPEELYKALIVAKNKGLLNSFETNWNKPIRFGELLNFMIKAYTANQDGHTGYMVNAKTGANAGKSLFVAQQEVDTDTSTTVGLGGGKIQDVRDITDLNDLLAVYGNEIDMTDDEIAEAYENANKFTFEAVDKFMMVDFCTALNVRTGPTTDFRILGSVPKGTKVHVVAFCKETGWYRIIANKKIVYQCEVYFSEFEGADKMLKESEANSNAKAFDEKNKKEEEVVETSEFSLDTLYTDEIKQMEDTEYTKYNINDFIDIIEEQPDKIENAHVYIEDATVSSIDSVSDDLSLVTIEEDSKGLIKTYINTEIIEDIKIGQVVSIDGYSKSSNDSYIISAYTITK